MVDLTFQTNKIQPIHFNMTNKTSQNKVKKRTEQKREEKRHLLKFMRMLEIENQMNLIGFLKLNKEIKK